MSGICFSRPERIIVIKAWWRCKGRYAAKLYFLVEACKTLQTTDFSFVCATSVAKCTNNAHIGYTTAGNMAC
jgi:hypothetical protein